MPASETQIERIVFSGGGAKGVLYPGAYQALAQSGLLKQIKMVAGASAGAITGAFVAAGMKPLALRDALLTTNMENLLGNRIGKINPFSQAPGTCYITRDGAPFEQYIREFFVNAVKTNLSELKEKKLIPTDQPKLDLVISKLDTPTPCITFADLALLHNHFPEQFKTLTLVAVKHPSGVPQVFNHILTPDVEVALACRASASIPVIFKPVDITINGVTETYVDGGLYMNMPTDYFDMNEQNQFMPNQKSDKTLVFSFGEGSEDQKNPVFQALYAQRWDEVISIDELTEIFMKHEAEIRALLTSVDIEYINYTNTLTQLLQAYKRFNKDVDVAPDKIAFIFDIFNKVLAEVVSRGNLPAESSVFASYLTNAFVENAMPPLYQPDLLTKVCNNYLVSILGGLKANYQDTVQNQLGFEKIRREYPLRTIELRVGDIKTTDFKKTALVSRTMDALGFLDTLNHLINHELHDDLSINEKFYPTLLHHFEVIYQTVLLSADKSVKNDPFLQSIETKKVALYSKKLPEAAVSREIVYFIKHYVELNLASTAAFALSRAVEVYNHTIQLDVLVKEVTSESCKETSNQGFGRFFKPKKALSLPKDFTEQLSILDKPNDYAETSAYRS